MFQASKLVTMSILSVTMMALVHEEYVRATTLTLAAVWLQITSPFRITGAWLTSRWLHFMHTWSSCRTHCCSWQLLVVGWGQFLTQRDRQCLKGIHIILICCEQFAKYAVHVEASNQLVLQCLIPVSFKIRIYSSTFEAVGIILDRLHWFLTVLSELICCGGRSHLDSIILYFSRTSPNLGIFSVCHVVRQDKRLQGGVHRFRQIRNQASSYAFLRSFLLPRWGTASLLQ